MTCSCKFVRTKDTTLLVYVRDDLLFLSKVQLELVIYPEKVSNQTRKFSMALFTVVHHKRRALKVQTA